MCVCVCVCVLLLFYTYTTIQAVRENPDDVALPHTYTYTNISRNIIKHNIRTSMNERTHFFIKIYLSHFILERFDVGCVGEMSWRRGQTAMLTPSSSDHSSTSFSSRLGCSTVGHWGPIALCLPLALTSASCLQLTQSVCVLVILLFRIHLLPLFFHYLHRSISWLTARSRANMLQWYNL